MNLSFEFDPQDPIILRIKKQVFGQWRALSEMVTIGAMLLMLWVVSEIVLYRWGDFFTNLHPQLLLIFTVVLWGGITLGLLGAYLAMLFVSRFRDLISDRAADTSLYRAGPVVVGINAEGLSVDAPNRTQKISWSCVQQIVESPVGLGLRLDDQDFVPVPDQALPEGMTRTDVLGTFKTWRSGAR